MDKAEQRDIVTSDLTNKQRELWQRRFELSRWENIDVDRVESDPGRERLRRQKDNEMAQLKSSIAHLEQMVAYNEQWLAAHPGE